MLRVAIRQSAKQYLSVGRIRRFASLSGSHKTVLARRPDKMLAAIRQSQNSTVRRPDKTFHVAIRQSQNSIARRPDKMLRVAIRQSDERYQDTSNWFIRRINWFGSFQRTAFSEQRLIQQQLDPL